MAQAVNAFTFALRDSSPLYKMLPGECRQTGNFYDSLLLLLFAAARLSHPFIILSRLLSRASWPANPVIVLQRCHSASHHAESLDRQHITFQTVRPGDYPTPYELMLKQGVQFSAVDRKGSRLTMLMVSSCGLKC